MPLLRLFVKTSEGENIPVDASDTDRIQDVKNHLYTQGTDSALVLALLQINNPKESIFEESKRNSNSSLTLFVRPSTVLVQSIDTLSLAITVPQDFNQGKNINLRLSTRDLVYHVKKKISKSTGISIQHLKLCWQQNSMHNSRRLSHYFLPQTTNHITLQYLGEPRAAFVGRDTDYGHVNVFVRTSTGKTLNMLVFTEGTVQDFKVEIQERECIPVNQQ